MQHPCVECGKTANHKVVRIINGQISEAYYCNEHAPGAKTSAAQSHLHVSLEDLLNSLLSQAAEAGTDKIAGSPEPDFKCGVCGLPFSQYRRSLILGCDRCYESFSEQMREELNRLHGARTHEGRRPKRFTPHSLKAVAQPMIDESESAAPAPKTPEGQEPVESPAERIERLKTRMATAVEAEDFETAARLRDKINALTKDLSGHDE